MFDFLREKFAEHKVAIGIFVVIALIAVAIGVYSKVLHDSSIKTYDIVYNLVGIKIRTNTPTNPTSYADLMKYGEFTLIDKDGIQDKSGSRKISEGHLKSEMINGKQEYFLMLSGVPMNLVLKKVSNSDSPYTIEFIGFRRDSDKQPIPVVERTIVLDKPGTFKFVVRQP